MTTVTYVDGTTMRYGFDGMGRQVSATDQAGRVTAKGYDDAGQLTSVTDALGQVTRYGYDLNGNLSSQTDAAGRVTGYQWDALNRRTRRTLPLGQAEIYGYDAVGNMTSRTDFNGRVTGYQYDTLNRLLRKTPDGAFGAAPVQYSYTSTGQRATMTDATGVTSYVYDARDRLVSKSTPQGTLAYTHDAAGNVTAIRSGNANGGRVSYTFDRLNRVETVLDERSGGVSSYAYSDVGSVASVVYPNGVRHEFAYDTLERLTSLPVTAGGLVQRFDYTLGAAGHRLSATSLTGRRSGYSYDSVYKLTGEAVTGDPTPANNGTLGYSYDAVGNRLGMTSTLGVIAGRTYSYDLNDRLGGDSYDANGNTLASGGVSYQWDFEDRMVGAGTVQFLYDGDGNRVGKVAGGVTTLYLVDELNPTGYAQVVDEVVGGAVARTYTLGLQRVSQNWVSPGLVSNYYVYDGHGSVRALTDGAGAVTDAYEYDAFGVLVASSGSTPNPYLYTGEWFEGGLGLYYLRARWYRPAVGRFLSADAVDRPMGGKLCPCTPAKLRMSATPYAYSESDPVNFRDPSGFFRVRIILTAHEVAVVKEIATAAWVAVAVHCAAVAKVSIVLRVLRTLGLRIGDPFPGIITLPCDIGDLVL